MDDDDDNEKDGAVGRGRNGRHQECNAQRLSLPRDDDPLTRKMLEFVHSLSTSPRPAKNKAEPHYFFQGEDIQDSTNWLTASENYFNRNPTQWENNWHHIVVPLGKTKGNKVAPLLEKYRKVMGGLGGDTQDPSYFT